MNKTGKVEYPALDPKRTGENIRAWRKKKQISVSELQEYLGLAAPNAIYQWERGVSLPTVDNLYAVSRYMDVPMEEILVELGPPPQTG